MKSNPSPSAPLNLCAPVGVTGTTLPDSGTSKATIAFSCYETAKQFAVKWSRFSLKGYSLGPKNADGSATLTLDGVTEEHKAWIDARVSAILEASPTSPVKDTSAVALTHEYRKHSHSTNCATCGHAESDHAPASPVDSVGDTCPGCGQIVVGGDKSCPVCGMLFSDVAESPKRASGCIYCPSCGCLAGTSSHAAKDAKIKALTEALADAIPTLEGDLKKTKEIAHLVPEIYADKAERISRLRAALALPCAPQES